MTQRIEHFFLNMSLRIWTLFLICLVELNPLSNMSQRIEPIFQYDSKELNLFSWIRLKELNLLSSIWRREFFFLLHITPRIGPFFFEHDTENWTIENKDSKNWSAFQYDSKELNFFVQLWLEKELNLFSPFMIQKNWTFFLIYDSKELNLVSKRAQWIEPLFQFDSNNSSLSSIWLEELNTFFFFEYDSKNWTFFFEYDSMN